MKYEDIQPYIEKGLISEQVHPEHADIHIFNYTHRCQWEKSWDDVTMQCRGLIMNVKTGNILARPFPKFFNYQEHIAKGLEVPNEVPVITEKLDGSLGILYEIAGIPWIATRGSFTSDQAVWATKWWRENIGLRPGEDRTLLFEIIYPENRIVVQYDFSGLVFLCAIQTSTGDQLVSEATNMRKAKTIPVNSLAELEGMDKPNSEGFVAWYPKANLRLKLKFPEYVRLHRIMTGVSEKAIWEYLKDDKPLDALIEKVPDEFYNWVTRTVNVLKANHLILKSQAENDFGRCKSNDRKEFAFLASHQRHPHLMFLMYDKKPIDQAIWKMIRPKGVTGFKTDIDA